jgi:hypothetical protein
MKKIYKSFGKMSKCENGGKNLNIRKYEDNIRKILVSKPQGCGLHVRGGDRAQMLLVAGIVMSVSIILASLIATNLSNVGLSLTMERSTSLLQEYRNVRYVFITILNETCNGYPSNIRYAFNYTRDALFDIETRHGNYFIAELQKIVFFNESASKYANVYVYLSLTHEDSHVDESFAIPVWIRGGE